MRRRCRRGHRRGLPHHRGISTPRTAPSPLAGAGHRRGHPPAPAGQRPPGAEEGRNGFGTDGYRGPCPPRGDRPHRYLLTVYATDRRPPVSAGASLDTLRRALSGHTLATATLTGRYGH
ncbi:YbhB/YbcL family Raf kinase inhibitor-like protein [Streptomyces sp. NEAU-sy36]|uniref:YbhB/YbcL family Raf kinase inhibitor-like protein n=1 Tax=Streptomyces sp. NEAU-H33 TaxID=2979463 RepID=UPI0015D64673|nr:YbhB/YbcL family Raf kinase inhibitor-like protein [Streptomyces sp. NEAU-H33]QLJ06521.1 YbhB/YbcL family Raf kinase inhibitor-like protein [Streptomyces sp. NEAU-sy36]